MKYVLLVIFLSQGVGGDYDGELYHTQFTIEYPTQEACFNALVETEARLLARENVRALSVSCRPKHYWDTPMTGEAFDMKYPDERLADQ